MAGSAILRNFQAKGLGVKDVVLRTHSELDPAKPDGTPGKLMDSTRLNNLGWQASVSLEEGLRLAYSDFLKNHTSVQ
jgi:nucleoside-diphosphate-sugar epimerase